MIRTITGAVALAACYAPEAPIGAPCSPDGECPPDQFCVADRCHPEGCELLYADRDHDGHGDPSSGTVQCSAPADMVGTDDDCDDGDALRYPAAAEVCDRVDNDCDAATPDRCPADCVLESDPLALHLYLFCGAQAGWHMAAEFCDRQWFHLVEIASSAENTFVRARWDANFSARVGENLWIGATDEGHEAVWQWHGGGVFWDKGVTQPGYYENWRQTNHAGEPNNAGTAGEHCGLMYLGGEWNDDDCGDALAFVCRR
jgi:hypothetical protein